MDTIEKRAREIIANEHRKAGDYLTAKQAESGWEKSSTPLLQSVIAALTPPEGHVVVTRNEAGQAVAVTRQDDEDRILSVIAEFDPPEGYVLVPVELPDMGGAPNFTEGKYSRSNWHAASADLQWLAARPEVPNVND